MKKILSIIIVSLLIGCGISYAAFSTDRAPYPVYTGVNSTSTTATSYTMVAGDIVGYYNLVITPNTGNLLLTLPASSTLSSWVPYSGNTVTLDLFNATTTSGINIGLYAGTGTLLSLASSSNATTTSQRMTEIRVMRKPNTDLLFTVYPAM